MNPIAKLMLLVVVVAANIVVVVPPPRRTSRAVGAGISCLLAFKRGIITGDPMGGLLAPWKRDGHQAPPAATPRHLGRHVVQELRLGPTGRVPESLGSFKNLRYHNLSSVLFSGRVLPQLGNLSKMRYLNLPQSNDDLLLDLLDSAPQMESTDTSWLARLSLLRLLDMIRLN